MAAQQTINDLMAKGMNVVHRSLLTVSGGRIGSTAKGMQVVQLHTTGRTSGQRRSVMLTCPIYEANRVVIIASKGGDDRHPDWYRNLVAQPDVELTDGAKEILVREGGLVEPNQLIAQLYAREEGAAVEIAKTELAHAVAELDLVKVGPREEQIEIAELRVEMMKYEHQFREKEAKRAQGLFDENAANQSELEDAQRSRDSSETMLKSADDAVQRLRQGSRPESIRASEARVATWKAKLAEAEQMFELREIRSSIAGRVRTPNVELRRGHMVQPGDVICEIQNVDPLRVEVFADEAAVVHVKIGDAVAVRLNGLYGALLKGKVLNIGLLARAESELLEPPSRSDREHQNSEGKSLAPDGRNYVRVVVDFDAAGQQLIPGMTGYARISLRTEPFFKVIWRHVLRFFLVDVWSWLP